MSHHCQVCNRKFSDVVALNMHKKAKGHGRGGQKTAHPRSNGRVSNAIVTAPFLDARAARAAAKGFPEAKWISFCRSMMAAGFSVSLYEARKTVSKYVTVSDGERSFKVRFSNHRPILARESAGDCDFFVGINNHVTTTTEQALAAVRAFFSEGKAA